MKLIIVCLLALVVLFLADISKEVKSQRTPEQIAEMQKNKEVEKQTEKAVKAQKQRDSEELISIPWSEVKSPAQAILKFIAHGYHLWIIIIAFVSMGPAIFKKVSGY